MPDATEPAEGAGLARGAAELETLAAGIRVCERCRLGQSRQYAVPGSGPATAKLVILGEAPGTTEDRLGQPFVGPAGKLLDSLLRDNGLERPRIFITNTVKCRPPRNRPPRQDELDICRRAWLDPQLAFINPRLVVLLGQVATHRMLGGTATVTALHGMVVDSAERSYFVSYHPAAALRFGQIAAALREDFAILGRWAAEYL